MCSVIIAFVVGAMRLISRGICFFCGCQGSLLPCHVLQLIVSVTLLLANSFVSLLLLSTMRSSTPLPSTPAASFCPQCVIDHEHRVAFILSHARYAAPHTPASSTISTSPQQSSTSISSGGYTRAVCADYTTFRAQPSH
jgi:hypothetical protein